MASSPVIIRMRESNVGASIVVKNCRRIRFADSRQASRVFPAGK